MTMKEAIAQLESLKEHCTAMILEHGEVWKKDVQALDTAMEIIREQV